VRDDTLVQKLCHTLRNILGDTLLAADTESHLLASFSPNLEFVRGRALRAWSTNLSEAHSRSLLDKGFLVSAERCLWEYGGCNFGNLFEHLVEGGSSKVDYVALVDNASTALCEAKSPSVMKKVGELLPARGIELQWIHSQSLVRKILGKVTTYFFVSYNVSFNEICVVRIVFGSETAGMAVSFLP